MGGAGEAAAVTDGDQQHGGGPDRDPGHRGQDRRKRVASNRMPIRVSSGSLLLMGTSNMSGSFSWCEGQGSRRTQAFPCRTGGPACGGGWSLR